MSETTDWFAIPHDLIKEGLQELMAYLELCVSPQGTVEIPPTLADAIIHTLSVDNDEPDTGLFLALELAKVGHRICTECGGDGETFSQEMYDQRYAELSDEDRGWDWGEGLGIGPCPRCHGTGKLFLNSGLPAGPVITSPLRSPV